MSRDFKEWLLTLFQKADADSSGTVNDRELTSLLSYLNLQLSEARAAALAEAVAHNDSNHEGIRFNDFFLWMRRLPLPLTQHPHPTLLPMDAQASPTPNPHP